LQCPTYNDLFAILYNDGFRTNKTWVESFQARRIRKQGPVLLGKLTATFFSKHTKRHIIQAAGESIIPTCRGPHAGQSPWRSLYSQVEREPVAEHMVEAHLCWLGLSEIGHVEIWKKRNLCKERLTMSWPVESGDCILYTSCYDSI
jgi:hypothetical protein